MTCQHPQLLPLALLLLLLPLGHLVQLLLAHHPLQQHCLLHQRQLQLVQPLHRQQLRQLRPAAWLLPPLPLTLAVAGTQMCGMWGSSAGAPAMTCI